MIPNYGNENQNSYLYLFCFRHLIKFILGSRNEDKRSIVSHENLEQIRIQVILPVPAGCDSTKFYADVKESFFKSYKNENKFQISLQGLGTETWLLEGRVKFTNQCKLKNARERIKGILLKCHKRLGFSDATNQAFIQHLGQTANLNVKKDTEPFAGESHRWISNGSSGEHNAQGAPLRLPPHSSSFSSHKMHISLRTSPGQ